MKIQQLHINRFGHFNECDLVFPGDGMQVIYGPNEAGKTTLLEFLRGLLFDFPTRTPYDFGDKGEMAGVATLTLRDGRSVELRRRKGNKDKVTIKLDGNASDLDDAGWLRLLDHADRGLFESVFAFGLDQLSQGELSLKHDSVQSALFGGSLGGNHSPDKVVAELTRQADELFKKGGSKPAINVLVAELKDLTKKIKERSLRPDKFHEAESNVTKLAERAEALHQQVEQLRREHSKIEKRVRAWPKWWELQQRRAERDSIGSGLHSVEQAARMLHGSDDVFTSNVITGERPLLRIPANARQQFQTLSTSLKSLAGEQAKCISEIEQAERRLVELKLDPGAVSYRTEIKACVEQRQSYIDAKHDLPEIQRKREASRLQIERELSELRPGWTHADLQAFSVDVSTRAEIDRLSHESRERTKLQTTFAAKRDSDAANFEHAQNELAEIGSPHDVTAIVAVLADEADFVANRKQAESIGVDLAKLERKLTTQIRRLTPPLITDECGSPLRDATLNVDRRATLGELPVPRQETLAEFGTRFAAVREQLRIEQSSLAEDEVKQREIDNTLASAMSRQVVPSLDERDAARERRDAGWNLVHQKYIAGEQADVGVAAWLNGDTALSGSGEPGDVRPRTNTSVGAMTNANIRGLIPPGSPSQIIDTLPDGYEQAVRVADNIADQIYDNAKEVAEREGLRRQLKTLAARLEQKRLRIADLDRQQAELQAEWFALWKPCGFEPLAPDAMLAWLKDHGVACATIAQRDELLVEQSRLAERIALFEQSLRAASGGSTLEPSVLRLLQLAKQSVDDAKDQQRRAIDLQKEARRLDKQIAKYDADLQNLAEREGGANAEWHAVLSRLNLPASWSAELAREVIDKLSATRVRLATLPGEEARIDAMQSRIGEFNLRVRSLCESLDVALLRDPPELAIEKLAEQVEQAVEAQRRHDALSQKLSAAREQAKSLSERHHKLDGERTDLFALACAATEAEFLEVVTRTEKIVRLDAEIDQLQRDIDNVRAGDDREEFEASLAHSERVILEGEQRDLAAQLLEHESQYSAAREAVGAARKELAQLDGSSEVASLTEELSRKRSLLAAEVDRYMPLIFARHLLNAAVSRFEKENQPVMIKTVSRLLSQMTGGKYVEFDRSSGSKQHVLIRRFDGVERTPDQLSTGTREQLYLAIRLAYVLHYCEKNQPLPIVIDDVLVNFDEARSRQTLTALADISRSAQVLFFTCHPHMVRLAQEVVPGLTPIELPSR
ncbi:MAG: AAA family ATPase [Planctomycetia bacterium]|nr:AAA family ATPase [Planctomycetia bacterium]